MHRIGPHTLGWAMLICVLIGTRSLRAAEPPSTQPFFSCSVNDSASPVIARGWPIVVDVFSLNIPPGQKLVLHLADSSGKQAEWDFKLFANTEKQSWVLSSENSAKLLPGDYQISVQLSDGQNVVDESSSCSVKIVESLPDSEDRFRALVKYDVAIRDDIAAAKNVASWLAAYPKSVFANTAAGDLALSQSRLADAKKAYDTAVQNANVNRKSSEPPMELIDRENAVVRLMAKEAGERRKTAATQPKAKK